MYAIVKFEDYDEVELVPKSWITNEGKSALWPKFMKSGRISKLIKEKSLPEESWQTFKISVMCEEDNYEKARKKLKLAEDTSCLSSESSDLEKKNRKDRKRKAVQSESSDENEDVENTTGRKKNHKTLAAPRPFPIFISPEKSDSGADSLSKLMSNRRVESPEEELVPRNILIEIQIHVNAEGEFSTHRSQSASQNEKNLPTSENGLKKILRQLSYISEETRRQVKFNTSLLNQLITHDTSNDEVCDLELPLKSEEDLANLTSKRKNNEALKKQLLRRLGCMGGTSVNGATRRILEHVIAHELALKMSWTGRSGKLAFRETGLREIINDGVRKNPLTQTASDDSIESVIKNWFRFAGDRKGGRMKRQNKTL